MKKLYECLDHDDVMGAALHIAHHFCPDIDVDQYVETVHQLAEYCIEQLPDSTTDIDNFRRLVDIFYHQLLFSAPQKQLTDHHCLLNKVIDMRYGFSVTLAMVLWKIAKIAGFNVYGINFPGHFLLGFQSPNQRRFVLDPVNGQFLDYHQLQGMYKHLTGDDELDDELLAPASSKDWVVRLLENLKVAFIDQQRPDRALYCVDWLVHLSPDNPYERRDRGMLLHQLRCTNSALVDYQFFIRHCPDDPAAHLLKLQLRQWPEQLTTFH